MVGAVGFVADASFTLVFHRLGLDRVSARVLAFLVAATATWWLNRNYTFRTGGGAGGLLRYLLTTSGGALINVSVYLIVVGLLDMRPVSLVSGVAAGSVVALGFNYWVSQRWVFRAHDSAPWRQD